METLIICFIGLILGAIISQSLGDSKGANIVKILMVIALILFALWNEGVI